ncbi:Hypothetical protein NTJ_12834 [Nesidiocoris tenuis]|uniref:Uncharacterized protein n=1 Tax=Nesidiocoris tenuis TaxID=355587 RepID=A0ABN7B6I8_9HEMI|nr:Hypothetical protein NTJ_12834 [Nesidiocoris tenuis]
MSHRIIGRLRKTTSPIKRTSSNVECREEKSLLTITFGKKVDGKKGKELKQTCAEGMGREIRDTSRGDYDVTEASMLLALFHSPPVYSAKTVGRIRKKTPRAGNNSSVIKEDRPPPGRDVTEVEFPGKR